MLRTMLSDSLNCKEKRDAEWLEITDDSLCLGFIGVPAHGPALLMDFIHFFIDLISRDRSIFI